MKDKKCFKKISTFIVFYSRIITAAFTLITLVFLMVYLSKDYHVNINQTVSPVIIYMVTPTYNRSTQMADLTTLAQTLSLVPNLHWILVEDAIQLTSSIKELLRRMGITYTHLNAPTPMEYKAPKFGRGVFTRIKALEWIRAHVEKGVLYFGDDDNSYDIRIFEEIRSTSRVSVFPVGLMLGFGFSSPVVVNGKVVDFFDYQRGPRRFPVDMAGFAVNIEYMNRQGSKATFVHSLGHLEDEFLKGMNIEISDLEPKASNCTQVLVWHTQTKKLEFPNRKQMLSVRNYQDTNLIAIYDNLLPSNR